MAADTYIYTMMKKSSMSTPHLERGRPSDLRYPGGEARVPLPHGSPEAMWTAVWRGQVLYLTSRPITMATSTRQYLNILDQRGESVRRPLAPHIGPGSPEPIWTIWGLSPTLM